MTQQLCFFVGGKEKHRWCSWWCSQGTNLARSNKSFQMERRTCKFFFWVLSSVIIISWFVSIIMWCSTSNFVWSSCVSSSQMLSIIINIHFIFSHHHHHQLCPSCAPSWTLLHFIFSDHQHCQPFFSPFHLLYSSTSSLCSHFIFSLHHMMNFVPIFPLLLSLPSSTMLSDVIFSLHHHEVCFPFSLYSPCHHQIFFCFIFSPHPHQLFVQFHLFLLAIINFCSNFIFLSLLPSSTLFQFHLFSCHHCHQLCNVFPIFIFFLLHHHQDFVPISIFSSITHHQLTFVPGYSPSLLTLISCTNSGGSG